MNIICLFRTWPYSCIWLCNTLRITVMPEVPPRYKVYKNFSAVAGVTTEFQLYRGSCIDKNEDSKIDSIISNKNNMKSSSSSSRRFGGGRGVMVIVIGNGHGDTSSNPGRD